MTELSQDRLAAALRDVFAELDPGPTIPATLRERLDASLSAVGQRDRAPFSLRLGPTLARWRGPSPRVIAAVAALVVMALVWRPGGPLAPGAPGSGAPSPAFDPTLPTAGLVAEPAFGVPTWLPSMLVLTVPLILWRRPTRRRVVAAGTVAAASLGLLLVLNQRPLVAGSMYRLVLDVASAPAGVGMAPDGLEVVAGPGQPFALAFGIRNAGALTMRLDGFVDVLADVPGETHWTGVWVQGPAGAAQDGDERLAVPFTPFELGPGEERLVFLTGRAGGCALGRPSGEGDARLGLRIRPVASILGIPIAGDLVQEYTDRPWFDLWVPTRTGCSPGT